MPLSPGRVVVLGVGDGSLYLFANDDGSSAWSTVEVAGPGTASPYAFASWPAVVRYPSHRVGQFGGTDIAVVGPPGS